LSAQLPFLEPTAAILFFQRLHLPVVVMVAALGWPAEAVVLVVLVVFPILHLPQAQEIRHQHLHLKVTTAALGQHSIPLT
jgi:hypothetical protein